MARKKVLGAVIGIGALCGLIFAAQEQKDGTRQTEQNVLMHERAAQVEKEIQGKEERQISHVEENAQEEGALLAELRAPGMSYQIAVSEGSTVYDLMAEAQRQSGFTFRGKEFWGLGFFVEEINGVAESSKNKMRWIYYVNGRVSSVGVSQYIVQANDIIEWRYEKEH